MIKIVAVMMLIFLFLFGYAVARSVADDIISGSGGRSDVSKLIGKTVRNFQGDVLGTIRKLVKGPEGRIAFAMLNYQESNTTQKTIAIPIGALSHSEQVCVLNASRETVRTTPIFFSEDDLTDTRTAADIYLYYGQHLYWTEERAAERN